MNFTELFGAMAALELTQLSKSGDNGEAVLALMKRRWPTRRGLTMRCSRRRGSPSLSQAFVPGAADLVSLGVREHVHVQAESSDRGRRVIDRVAAAAKLLEIKEASRAGFSLRKMVSILIHGFGFVPVCEGQINKGARLARARLNPTEVLYNCEKDLSYRPDDWGVRRYGRASVPVRSVFYGVLGNESREATVETLLCEAHEIFRNTESASDIVPHEFYCTFGVWKVTDPTKVAEMVFSTPVATSKSPTCGRVKFLHL